jgi:hypothetical protein
MEFAIMDFWGLRFLFGIEVQRSRSPGSLRIGTKNFYLALLNPYFFKNSYI